MNIYELSVEILEARIAPLGLSQGGQFQLGP